MRRLVALPLATLAAALFLAMLTAPAARADDLAISAFYGDWQGNAISESGISLYFQLTVRDLNVRIEPREGEGFVLYWSTVQRQTGDPDAPTERLRETRLEFVPREGSTVWWGTATGDPRDGGQVQWARIDGNTLIVNSFAVREDGSSELQTYYRTLTERGMELDFRRVLDGEVVRTAKGVLTK